MALRPFGETMAAPAGAGGLSFACWYTLAASSGGNSPVLFLFGRDGANDLRLLARNGDGKLELAMRVGGASLSLQSTAPVGLGLHHVLAVLDQDSQAALFVDGALASPVATLGPAGGPTAVGAAAVNRLWPTQGRLA